MAKAKITERTLYPLMIKLIREEIGGSALAELRHEDSYPDIVFEYNKEKWLLGVKIGENVKLLKDAFVQYSRHKQESGIERGILIFFPESIRSVGATEDVLEMAIKTEKVTALIDAGVIQTDISNLTFPRVIRYIKEELQAKLALRREGHYSLSRVIEFLQQQVVELMEALPIDEEKLLEIIMDEDLLKGLGHIEAKDAQSVGRFLASYIFLTQILFLRLLSKAHPEWIPIVGKAGVNHDYLDNAFKKILEINYKPIFEINVLDSIGAKYLKDTYDLIWGLEIERVRYELPGRIFHELMPHDIRKMLAAFYTRPIAASLLANLTISNSDAKVFDAACGSGTILTAAYKRKLELYYKEGFVGEPHKKFCENDIFGADIMPFAVHLASANLAALNPGTSIDHTQIIQADSLKLESTGFYFGGLQIPIYSKSYAAKKTSGEEYKVDLDPADAVLMNPPFTKIERGIQNYISLARFAEQVGSEIGLWGHFIPLANEFLKDDGIFGAVIPINVLRGRESKKARDFIFNEWSALYIIKPTRNYAFSEWSEYRDILVIARKTTPKPDHKVKFCLLKKDLTTLTEDDIKDLTSEIRSQTSLRDANLIDIESFGRRELNERFNNLMWFCGGIDLAYRDRFVNFISKFSEKFNKFPNDDAYCRTGLRTEGGSAKFQLLTRNLQPERVEKAFLRFERETRGESIAASSPLNVQYLIEKEAIIKSLRTPVGLSSISVDGKHDYLAVGPYTQLTRVCNAADIDRPPREYWRSTSIASQRISTHLCIVRRINPFSPSQTHVAFFSEKALSPTDQFNVILEKDKKRAKALCVILNSIIFYSQFFLLKEESTGRYIDLRLYDYAEMLLIPDKESVASLARVFDEYASSNFPCLAEQFDANFQARYAERNDDAQGTPRLISVYDEPIAPNDLRLSFDLAVCKALGIPTTVTELTQLYEIFVKEMILIRGLTRD